MRLPWTMKNVPHAVLDIMRGCNICCRDCYNTDQTKMRTLDEVASDLDSLMRLRKLHSVSIVGGEPTLHPDLVKIVKMVSGRGLFVELFTNGVLLDSDLLTKLRSAGANLIFLHIEHGQQRPDLPVNASAEDIRHLRTQKAALITAHGLEAALAVTVYPDNMKELDEAVRFTLESPDLLYLLVTLWRDSTILPMVSGGLESGFETATGFSRASDARDRLTNKEISQRLKSDYHLTPFAYMGSNLDPDDHRWISFMVATVHRKGIVKFQNSLHASSFEKFYLSRVYKSTGRYPFYQPHDPKKFSIQLLLNALSGGKFFENIKTLFAAFGKDTRLSAKRLLFQCPADIDDQGRVIHCQCCPDAVMKNGQLVPLCMSDRVSAIKAGN